MLDGLTPEVEGSFDPKAYLAKKRAAQPDFDPKAYLASKGAKSAPEVGPGETALNDMADTLPVGRELVNALSAVGMQHLKHVEGVGEPGARLTPQAKEEMRLRGIEVPEEKSAIPGLVDSYRQARDTRDVRTAAGDAQNPPAAMLGKVGGLALSLAAPLPKVAVGQGAAGRVLSNALTGAAYGGVNGAANSKGDLLKGEVGQVASDALGAGGIQDAYSAAKDGHVGDALLKLLGSGALGGGAAGGALGLASEGLRKSGVTQMVADWIRGKAIDKGRKVLTNGADQLSSRQPISEAAVEEAIRSGAIKPFGTNQGAAERLDDLRKATGGQYAEIVKRLEAGGVEGPEARAIADQLLQKGAAREPLSGADKSIPNAYLAEAQNAEAVSMGKPKLGLSQSEAIKRDLAEKAHYGRVEETPLNRARKDMASVYRQATEDAIDAAVAKAQPGSEVSTLGSQFEPVKRRLGSIIEASDAANRGAARGAQRGAGSDFGIKASAAALAANQPMLIPAAMASKFTRARLPSTMASAGISLSDLLRLRDGGGTTGKMAELILNAMHQDEAPAVTPAHYGSGP